MTAIPKGASNGVESGGGPKNKPAAANSAMTKKPAKKKASSLLRVGILLAALAFAALLLASSGSFGGTPPLGDKITTLRSLLEKRWDRLSKMRVGGAWEASGAPVAPSVAPSPSTCDATSLALAATKLAPLASRLVATPFFRHFKVALRCECPFWTDDGMCSMSDCAVCECPAEEVPEALRDGDEPRELASCSAAAAAAGGKAAGSDAVGAARADADAAVDREVEPGTRARLIAAKGWRGVDNPWMAGSVVAAEQEEEEEQGGGRGKRGHTVDETDEDDAADDDDGEEEELEELDEDQEEEEEEEEEEEDSYSFIDLLKNPERYTGYSGPSARRIWDFVYSQTCFGGRGGGGGGGGGGSGARTSSPSSSSSASAPASASSPSSGVCSAVQQTLYRVMSGVHSSISAHIAADYLLEKGDGGRSDAAVEATWGPNLALFAERLSLPEHAERVDNLRFAYAFVARALLSARPLLLAADYGAGGGGDGGGGDGGGGTGSAAATAATAESELVRALLTDPALEGVCAAPFDTARHLPLSGSGGGSGGGGSSSSKSAAAAAERALERELQAAFRNVTAVMDCVGCEKCKLWGKLQLMGVATALKVLAAERRAAEAVAAAAAAAGAVQVAALKPLVLERNEVVALVNLFERLSRSMNTVREMQARLDAGEIPSWPAGSERGSGGGGERAVTDALAGAAGVF